jgi:indolepyruvate ferredoxin oxidoreductase beta subunit
MDRFDIHLTGVGGQGIGLLSEVILRAADHAGLPVKGVDTHGLAQRGGIVVSQIRLGSRPRTALIPTGQADLAVALERHEALRAAVSQLRVGGTLIWYDAVWQPLGVRLGEEAAVGEGSVEAYCRAGGKTALRVFRPGLADPRMQNVVLLGRIAALGSIPGVAPDHFRAAMADLLEGRVLEANAALFEAVRQEGADPPAA